MHRPLLIVAVLILAAGAAWGQSTPPPDPTEQVKLLIERVQQLEKRVAELESKQGAAPASSLSAASIPPAQQAAPQQTAAPAGQEHQHGGQEEQAAVRQMETHFPSLQIRGFGDVDYSATDQKGITSGFNLGQLDLHLASALSPKVSYFGEVTFNAQPTGYTVEVERNIIRYDNNNNRAWVANIYSRPAKLYGLQLGVSVYRDKITLPITLPNGNNFREWISAAHVVWTKETPEFLAEFANVNHRNILTNFVTNSQAYYVQIGYRLPWFEKTLKPYYRFEHTHTPMSEEVFANQDLVGSIVGLRYDISNYAALKSEYRNTRRLPGEPRVNGLFLQTAFTF